MLECVVNVSEGRDAAIIGRLAGECGRLLLDVHSDADHNRSVFTLAGERRDLDEAVRALARAVVAFVDLSSHEGVHPRIGALDVVPWVALEAGEDRLLRDGSPDPAVASRDRFATWAGDELGLPCFLYGPERTLPTVRREAWKQLRPDRGPGAPHPTAGAAACGARPVLVAYNLWLAGADLAGAKAIAASVRGPKLRALGLQVGESVQVSCNLIAPFELGPGAAFDSVASRGGVERAELVGLVPTSVLRSEPRHRWTELGLAPSSTIEARLESAGLDGGRFDFDRS